MSLFLKLYYEFFKAGLFAVGGGLATLPFLKEIGDKTGWFTQAQLADMVAISESTPGPIGVNMATYVGFTSGGQAGGALGSLLGAVIATLGLITPSIIVILIVAKILKKFKDSPLVKSIFYGLRPASVGLIASAGLSVMMISMFHTEAFKASGNLLHLLNIPALILGGVVWLILKKIKPHPVVVLGLSAVVGIALGYAGLM